MLVPSETLLVLVGESGRKSRMIEVYGEIFLCFEAVL